MNYLQMSNIFCIFAFENKKTIMKKNYQPQESPMKTPNGNSGGTQQMYFTPEEAMAFMEPRIRAMFK